VLQISEFSNFLFFCYEDGWITSEHKETHRPLEYGLCMLLPIWLCATAKGKHLNIKLFATQISIQIGKRPLVDPQLLCLVSVD
jgi:hypothetical protein